MKKSVFLLILSLTTTCLNAQTLKFSLGPLVSSMDWDNSSFESLDFYNENYSGFQANLGINYLSKKYFFLNSSLAYSILGGDGSEYISIDDDPWFSTLVETETKLEVLSVNTTINFKYTFKNKLTPYIGLGPRLDRLLSYDENIDLLKEFENTDDLSRFIFGLRGLVGLSFELNRILIGLEFDYNYNLSKLVDQSSSTPVKISNEINYTYQSALFSIGYKLKK